MIHWLKQIHFYHTSVFQCVSVRMIHILLYLLGKKIKNLLDSFQTKKGKK